jgi:hypothetical protein
MRGERNGKRNKKQKTKKKFIRKKEKLTIKYIHQGWSLIFKMVKIILWMMMRESDFALFARKMPDCLSKINNQRMVKTSSIHFIVKNKKGGLFVELSLVEHLEECE